MRGRTAEAFAWVALGVAAGCARPTSRGAHPQPESAATTAPTVMGLVPGQVAMDRRATGEPVAGGVWSSTLASGVNLGPLNCYSQAEFEACSGRVRAAPSSPCGPIGATLRTVVFAGMNCSNCFTDCYCNATVMTSTCVAAASDPCRGCLHRSFEDEPSTSGVVR